MLTSHKNRSPVPSIVVTSFPNKESRRITVPCWPMLPSTEVFLLELSPSTEGRVEDDVEAIVVCEIWADIDPADGSETIQLTSFGRKGKFTHR